MNQILSISAIVLLAFSFSSCNAQSKVKASKSEKSSIVKPKDMEVAYFASGCFWCVEAVFESVEGVGEVISGYAGGEASTANYQLVSAGRTKHTEAVEVFYNADIVSYETLLKVFFGSQDPTTLNQQGPDRGTQYRSSIFYQNEEERIASENYIKELEEAKVYDAPITTEVVPYVAFYDAEEYHQDFERKNPNQGYVRAVSVPRLKKFQAKYPELLKKDHN